MPYKDPEIQKQYDRQKYKKNRERLIRLRMLRYQKNRNKEAKYMSEYARKKREEINSRHRTWRKNRYKADAEFRRKVNEQTKRYRTKHPEKVQARILRYQRKYPLKAIAQAALNAAIRSGYIVRPSQCSQCGKTCKPHGHHTDYSKLLEVVWLCPKCHKDAHRSDS